MLTGCAAGQAADNRHMEQTGKARRDARSRILLIVNAIVPGTLRIHNS
jgi:hypothetical protein